MVPQEGGNGDRSRHLTYRVRVNLADREMVHVMDEGVASLRELRMDFRAVKRKIERHGKVVITDRGEPAYVLQPLPRKVKPAATLPDYLGRMVRRQPRPLSGAETRRLWEEERGDR